MGDYTFYKLACYPDVNNYENERVPTKTLIEIDEAVCDMKVGVFNGCLGRWSIYAKWYESDDEMIALSEKFPEIHFILYGDGKDFEDMWIEHWIDGKCQHCHVGIIFGKFDRDMMTKKFSSKKTKSMLLTDCITRSLSICKDKRDTVCRLLCTLTARTKK